MTTAAPCMHGWPRLIDGREWGCPHRRCLELAGADYAKTLHQAARAEAEEAAKTAEDRLVEELHRLWAERPELRDLIGALGRFAEARGKS